jgi:NAD(P)-dependent dehydrogenase (short-subunit alcohol dehydrogenase family)
MGMFEGKVAIVTASGSGIGRATARIFAREGARVTVGDISEEGGQETVTMIRDAGGEARFQQLDVTREEDIAAMVGDTVAAWGRLDAAVNNAGHPGNLTTILDCTNEEWDYMHAMNLRSTFWGMRHQARAMVQNGGGAIVNIASMAGSAGKPNLVAYVTMKHGVIGLTRSAGTDLGGKGIRVNAVMPGLTRTRMALGSLRNWGVEPEQAAAGTPIGRLAEPEEQAEMAVWLCSDRASFITGSTFSVDGGASAI